MAQGKIKMSTVGLIGFMVGAFGVGYLLGLISIRKWYNAVMEEKYQQDLKDLEKEESNLK